MRTLMIGLYTLILILAVSSCSILPKTQPSAAHDLGYPDSNAPTENVTLAQQAPITVETPKWLSDNRIRYRLLYATPTQVRFYSLDRWIAPPPELFGQLLTASGKQWPNPIIIRLDVFEQQFIMHFTATTTPADNKQKLSTRDFLLQLPCPTADAKGAVNGFTNLTRRAVDNIQAWLMKTN
jgi:cholesterol transport system auxiliary component